VCASGSIRKCERIIELHEMFNSSAERALHVAIATTTNGQSTKRYIIVFSKYAMPVIIAFSAVFFAKQT
jgi:hypothetical protein